MYFNGDRIITDPYNQREGEESYED